LLLALRVLDAVRGLRHELEPFLWDLFSTDHASAVFAPLEPAERLIDETEASLEHRLPREVELSGFRFARHVGWVLVGYGDLATAIALRYGKALLDAIDSRDQVGTFALESLAHRL
jgi:hypothetical protein